MSKTVLITGANRGLGLALVEKFAKRENHVIVAAVRDPSNESARKVREVGTAQGTKVVVVKIESDVHASGFGAVEELRGKCKSEKKNIYKYTYISSWDTYV